MRGIGYYLLCTSAIALSSGAWAQAGGAEPTSAPDSEVQQLRDEIGRLKGMVGSLETRLHALEGRSKPTPAPPPPIEPIPQVAQANLSAICSIGVNSEAAIFADPKAFQSDCLGVDSPSEYDTVGLSTQLAASQSSSSIEVSGSYTWRSRDAEGDMRRSAYRRLKLGARSKIEDGKPVAFADLSSLGFTPGLVGFGEFEIGRSHRTSAATYQAAIRKGLDAARAACISHYQQKFVSGTTEAPSDGVARLPSSGHIAGKCSGTNLSEWMAHKDRSETEKKSFLTGIVSPLWGVGSVPDIFFGIRGEIARPKLAYFPLFDPANIGVPVITELPGNFPEGSVKTPRTSWSASLYGGHGFSANERVEGSITYQTQFVFPKGHENQTVCRLSNGAPFTQCHKVNTAPPFKTEGFVLGARGVLQIPRQGIIPSIGVELKGTYALDTRQFGLEMPVYFISDKDGKLNAGVKLAITDDGRTDQGYEIAGDAKAFFFVGTTFEVHPK